jgi:hypothetical protein
MLFIGTFETVAADNTLKTFTLGYASHLDSVASLKSLGFDIGTSAYSFGQSLETEFAQSAGRSLASGIDTSLAKMSKLRLADILDLSLTETELYGFVPVLIFGLDLSDTAWSGLDFGYGQNLVSLPDFCHFDFFGYDEFHKDALSTC